MKITKNQLRRIIREEKARLLREEDPFARDRRKFTGTQTVTDLLGDLHKAIDALSSMMEPFELADELRGIAEDIEDNIKGMREDDGFRMLRVGDLDKDKEAKGMYGQSMKKKKKK